MENIKNKLSAGYFFLSLGVLVSLIASVTSFFNLAFEVFNKKFPDVLNAVYQYGYNNYEFENLRSSLATLIIFFPVFLIITYFWKKVFKNNAGEYDIILRRWLVYVILFLSCVVVLVDLVLLVKYFVSGEITMRFIFKVLTALFGAKMILYYFLPEVWENKWKNYMRVCAIWFSIAGVLALIVWSFFVIGSPFKQRELQLDERRVQDLQNIQWQVINYWQQKEKLPESFKDLKDPLSGNSLPVPPGFEKGEVYEYAKLEKMKFQLCATFSLPMPKGWQEYQNYGGIRPMMGGVEVETGISAPVASGGLYYPYPGFGVNDSWNHEAGRTCFERTIDPEIYIPFSKQR